MARIGGRIVWRRWRRWRWVERIAQTQWRRIRRQVQVDGHDEEGDNEGDLARREEASSRGRVSALGL